MGNPIPTLTAPAFQNPFATETTVDPTESAGVQVHPLPGTPQGDDDAEADAAPADADAVTTPDSEPPAEEAPASSAEPVWERQQPERQRVPIASLTVDSDVQSRIRLYNGQVDEYADRMAAGETFPPLSVVDDGQHRYVVDGWHRLEAAKRLDREHVEVRLYRGDRSQALLYAAGANATHGLRRSNAEKQRAIKRVLLDPQWQRKANNWIAKHLRVDGKTVGKVRDKLEASSEIQKSATRQTSDGREMNVEAIGGAPEPAEDLFETGGRWMRKLEGELNQRAQWRDYLMHRFGEDEAEQVIESLDAVASLLEDLRKRTSAGK